MERGHPAREGVPLIKYDFFDKLRGALRASLFSLSKNLLWNAEGGVPYKNVYA